MLDNPKSPPLLPKTQISPDHYPLLGDGHVFFMPG